MSLSRICSIIKDCLDGVQEAVSRDLLSAVGAAILISALEKILLFGDDDTLGFLVED